MAQDVSASCNATLTALEIEPVTASITDSVEVTLEATEDCPRYVGRIIRGIDPTAATPLWMVEALRRSGIRSISATVDATNYVLMELGQPMHAFDLDRLQGNISVRRGRDGESLELLDGKQVELDDSLLAICDEAGPVALAGIMGGLDSGVTEATSSILLESAYFKPSTISGKARDLGLHTDASHRFERGVDPQGQVRAIERITALLLEIAGGQAGPLIHAVSEAHVPVQNKVNLRLARLNRVLGIELDEVEVNAILENLRMSPELDQGVWTVTAPSDRFDIEIEEDLIEEVARIFGYDNIPAALPAGELDPGHNQRRTGVVAEHSAGFMCRRIPGSNQLQLYQPQPAWSVLNGRACVATGQCAQFRPGSDAYSVITWFDGNRVEQFTPAAGPCPLF